MNRSVLTLVMFVTVLASAMAQSTAPDTVDEPRSGTPLPLSLTPPGGTAPHWLMGTAIRQRTLFRVKIYAFGLYVDPERARASLSRFAGVSAPTLEDDESFYRQLLDLDFDMTLRLVMMRTVDGDDVAEAFDDALRPRLGRAVTDTISTDELAALDRFRSYFDVDKVRTGTEVGTVKLRLAAVFDAEHGGFATGWSPVSWGSIDELLNNLTMPGPILEQHRGARSSSDQAMREGQAGVS